MKQSTSTYCQTDFNTTTAGAITPLVFTDEEKNSGFLDSKAQRKCLFSDFVFTGKERDEETGYGYFGARYMDHELTTTWLSVDPMADKYPSISPYAYCAWNPVKLVDPDGRIIDSASISQSISDILNPNNKAYQQQFAEIVNRLAGDKDAIYSFNQITPTISSNNSINTGSLTCLGKNEQGQALISINYTAIYPQSYIGESIVGMVCDYSLYEETYHAFQFLDGAIGFSQQKVDGPWQAFACDINDEFEAKRFAQNLSPNIADLGILKTMDDNSLKSYISICYPNLPKYSISAKSALNKTKGWEHVSSKEQLPQNIIMNF